MSLDFMFGKQSPQNYSTHREKLNLRAFFTLLPPLLVGFHELGLYYFTSSTHMGQLQPANVARGILW